MKWLLITYILINGTWETPDTLIPNWTPFVYSSETDCKNTQQIATIIEIQRFFRKEWEHVLPKRFECVKITGK